MSWVIWTILIGLLLSIFFYWNSRPVVRSKEEVIRIVESWLDGTVEHGEWDYFESCSIKDNELEAVRQKCFEVSINPEFTVNLKIGADLNEKGKNEVRMMLDNLKNEGNNSL